MKMRPAVLRVQPLYLKASSRRVSVKQAADHNARIGGDIAHIDATRTHLNQVMLGSGDIEADVLSFAQDYPRASKNGPVAGEIIATVHQDYFTDLSEEQRQKWAADSLAWALAEFDGNKKGKVVSCVWHRDEEAEHLHIIVVPIVECVSGNQYRKETITKINYAGVLGKPRVGEKGIPPAERLWGRKQTSYATFMADKGHKLVRGVKNRAWRKHKSPAQLRHELAQIIENLGREILNTPDGGMVARQKAIQYIIAQVTGGTAELRRELEATTNRAEALEQIVTEVSRMLGCETPAQLPQQARYLVYGLGCMDYFPQEVASEGRKIWEEVEAQQADELAAQKEADKRHIEIETKQPRRKPGQRKTKEERRAARAARRMEAERDTRLQQITHQITQMPREIGHAKEFRTTQGAFGTGTTHRVQETVSMPLQSGQ